MRGTAVRFAAFTFTTGLGISAASFAAVPPTVTETFTTNTDTYWEHQNTDPNQPVEGRRQDYGWSNTDLTGTGIDPDGAGPLTATGAGEFGGVFARDDHPLGVAADADFYGFDVGTLDPKGTADAPGDTLQWSATVRNIVSGASGIFVGFSNGAVSSAGGTSSNTFNNFVGIVLGDGFASRYRVHTNTNVTVFNATPAGGSLSRTGGGDPDGEGPLEDSGVAHRLSFTYDPGANLAADGLLSLSLDGTALATQTLAASSKALLSDFTRFGFFNVKTTPASGTTTNFFDDVTFSSENPLPGGGLAGDFNADAVVNATDIDLLCDRINAGTGPISPFDVNNDGSVNQADVNFEVTNILETKFGDTDTDGDVDLNDLGNLASGFQVPGEKRWSRGNFDCDLDVDLPDLGTLATNFDAGRAAALAAFEALVPEPASLGVLFAGAILMRRRDRR